jgi:hypothetical protein
VCVVVFPPSALCSTGPCTPNIAKVYDLNADPSAEVKGVTDLQDTTGMLHTEPWWPSSRICAGFGPSWDHLSFIADYLPHLS